MLLGLVLMLSNPADGWADTGKATDAYPPTTNKVNEPSIENADDKRNSAKKRRNRAPDKPTPFVERHQRELLGLLGLLILWLITRLVGQEETQVKRPSKRHSPLNAEEFARIAFSVIRGENVAEYRGLYLTGPEAVQTMGNQTAKLYLEQRTSDVFAIAFDDLFDRIPASARFEKGELNQNDVVELWVLDDHNNQHCIPIGQIVHVGAIMRLIAPAMGPESVPKIRPFNNQDQA